MTDHDRLIDDAAREMTRAPSPVDLRARVVGEIRGGGQARLPDEAEASCDNEAEASHRAWWYGLAAAAGILLAVFLGWPARRPVDHPTAPAVAQAPTQSSPRQDVASPTPDRRQAPTRARRASAASAPEPTIAALPALETPATIRIEPLDATTRPVPALDAVSPLEIEDLDIKPLTPPGQAAGGH